MRVAKNLKKESPGGDKSAAKIPSFFPQVEGLRTVAVFMVVFGHTMPSYIPGGGYGVDLFFAISGFLISGLLVREFERTGRVRMGLFYARRAVRLLPAMLLMLGVTAFWLKPSLLHVTSILFYFANWVRTTGDNMGPYGHMWSLAVEEQFYLAWPWVVFLAALLTKRSARLDVRLVVAGLALLGIVVANLLRLTMSDNYWRWYNGTDTRMDGLFVGVVLAMLLPRIWGTQWVNVIRFAALPAWLALAVFYVWKIDVILQSVIIPVIAVVIVAASLVGQVSLIAWVLKLSPVRWLGKISYGVYLWHFPLIFMLPTMNPKPRTLFVSLLAVVLAALSFYLVEQPISRKVRPRLK